MNRQPFRVKIVTDDEVEWSVVVHAYSRPQALAAAMNTYRSMLRAVDMDEDETVIAGLDLLCNWHGEAIFVLPGSDVS